MEIERTKFFLPCHYFNGQRSELILNTLQHYTSISNGVITQTAIETS